MNLGVYYYVALILQQQELDPNNPFAKLESFLTGQVIAGLLKIATPIAILAFMSLGIAAMMSTDEHARQKFKSGLWWTGVAAAICFLASSIVAWVQKGV